MSRIDESGHRRPGDLADAFAEAFSGMSGWRERAGMALRPCGVCGLVHTSQSAMFPIEWHHADEDLTTSTGKAVGRGVIGLSSPTEPRSGVPLRKVP